MSTAKMRAVHVRIVVATELPQGMELARELFVEYANQVGIDLSFQQFDREVANLPGVYERRGALLLALRDEEPAGCVALRELSDEIAELKRLYVRAGTRRQRIGHRLVAMALTGARDAGFRSVVLDTLPTMTAAQRLYEEMGFVDCEPYTHNPVAGARFMRLSL
jgi:ribosomal protein S18 acetylase RimI-like enzyme